MYPGSPPVRALEEVSVAVTAGELAAVTGPSGSGKSTLLHLMGTLDVPTSGIVRVTGLDVARMKDRTCRRCVRSRSSSSWSELVVEAVVRRALRLVAPQAGPRRLQVSACEPGVRGGAH